METHLTKFRTILNSKKARTTPSLCLLLLMDSHITFLHSPTKLYMTFLFFFPIEIQDVN